MHTDALATEFWILSLCYAANGVPAPDIGEYTAAEVMAWRFAERPRA